MNSIVLLSRSPSIVALAASILTAGHTQNVRTDGATTLQYRSDSLDRCDNDNTTRSSAIGKRRIGCGLA